MPDYSQFDKNQLIKIINRQDEELKTRKYGLVWDSEREPEQVVLDCENNLPILKRIKGKEIRTETSEDNILIEGDNYHALTVLNYTHKEKIDVIYIDPPYNTGNKDFIYNDRFVEREDGYRHSKWLSFMKKRLNLAKEILKKTGVIFISIDDNEIAQLKLLSDEIFDEKNFLATLVWRGMHTVRNSSKDFNRNTEYVLVYARDKKELIEPGKPETYLRVEKDKSANYPFDENDGKGYYKLDPLHARNFYTPFEYTFKNGVIWSAPNGRYPAYSPATMEEKDNKNEIVFAGDKLTKTTGKNIEVKAKEPQMKRYLKNVQVGVPPNTLLPNEEVGFNKDGTTLLREMFDSKVFDQPKPVNLIKYLLLIRNKKTDYKNYTVLDFMAGSGTTGHTVLRLNKEDGGNRKFILCTNNENNICTEVTYPRIQKAIKGYKKNGNGDSVDGLGGNLQYFKTGFVKKTKNRDQVKINLTRKCTEMLCVKENIFNLETEEKDHKIFSSNKKDKFLCIYYNFIEDTFKEFLSEIKKLKGKKIIYMFSMDNIVEKRLFAGIRNIKIEAIPQGILDVYKQLVKMNIPVKANVIFTDLNKAKTKIFTDKDKDDGARVLRVVLEKVIQKMSQDNSINILNAKGKEEKISTLNDNLFKQKIITRIEWEENRTYLAIGNEAAHGNYEDYDLKQVEKFYKHIQSLLNGYNV